MSPSILVFGFGNPGREDDGLGIAVADHIAAANIERVSTDSNYQLNAEDALTISEFDIVIFADASENEMEWFRFTRLLPEAEIGFTTHAMLPGSVLGLCHELYGKYPETYLLEIKGCQWAMCEGLSEKAVIGLNKACAFLEPLVRTSAGSSFADSVTLLS